MWSEDHVLYWFIVSWTTKEFALARVNIERFTKLRGRDIVVVGCEGFLAIAPTFTSDPQPTKHEKESEYPRQIY